MAENYTVQQGDTVPSVAKAFGFSDYRTIWNHPKNAALKQKRQSPTILFPGDKVFVPDREPKQETRSVDQRYKFQVKIPIVKLRLLLEDQYEQPIANANCTLVLGGETRHITTTGEGKIDEEIQPDFKEGLLVIQDAQTPYENERLAIKIGHLHPVEEVSGQIARLNNMGYFAGEIFPLDQLRFRSAVEEFQCEHSLTVDGDCGPNTQAKLKTAHGC